MSITVSVLRVYERFTERGSSGAGIAGLSQQDIDRLAVTLAPALTELEALRQSTVQTIDGRVVWMVPGAAIGAAILSLFVLHHHNSFAVLSYMGTGIALAWGLAFKGPYDVYRRAYKDKILPHVAACFGNLSYRRAQEPDLKRLATLAVVPHFDKREVEDEIFGTYRGVALQIVEARLSVTKEKESRIVFNGLLVDLTLASRSSGQTLVVKDAGLVSNALQSLRHTGGFRRVRLEDPRFEGVFEVYGTDQIAARALLTPAVMESLVGLGRGGDVPCMLAEDGSVQVAIRRGATEDHFEPPSIAGSINAGEHLATIAADLGFVLKLVDAFIEIPAIRPTGAWLSR